MDMNRTSGTMEELKSNPAEALGQGKAQLDRFAEKVSGIAPSNAFVIAALASIAVSAFLQMTGRRQGALFVGQWAPSFLLFGIFNKLTKTLGSD
jgi:uncharacterized membrane protein